MKSNATLVYIYHIRNVLAQYVIKLSLLFLAVGLNACGHTAALQAKWKEAEREREVLRDAYEAQQLRLRELEARLLTLEDQKGHKQTGDNGYSVTVNQRSEPKLARKNWHRDRMRALPVVMVKRDQINSVSIEKDEVQKKTVLPRKKSKRARKRQAPSTRNLGVKSERMPTLTTKNIAEFQPPIQRQAKPYDDTKGASLARLTQEEQLTRVNGIDNRATKLSSTIPSASIKRQTTEQSFENVSSTSSGARTEMVKDDAEFDQGDEAVMLLKQAKRLRKKGQIVKAMSSVKRLIAETPTHPLVPDALYLMGRLQIEKGENNLGKSTLLRLSRLYPRSKAAQLARKYLAKEGS